MTPEVKLALDLISMFAGVCQTEGISPEVKAKLSEQINTLSVKIIDPWLQKLTASSAGIILKQVYEKETNRKLF